MIGYVIAIVFLGLLAVIALLDATRGTPVDRVTARGTEHPPGVGDSSFLPTLETYTGTTLQEGHDLQLMTCGDDTYPGLWDDIRAAKRFVAVQMYYFKEGEVANQFRDALVERARAGVAVLFLYDAFGSKVSREYKDALTSAGVEIAPFRPLRIQLLHTIKHRAHSRAIVIDGEIGYTGGFGIDDKWLGDGRHHGQWRDTNVRLRGPAVTQLMGAFASCWAEATGELMTGPVCFPAEVPKAGNPPALAAIVHAMPTVGSTPAERLVALTLAAARRTLYITNPYFVPDDDVRRFLRDAARRGVDVRILTVGEESDVKSTLYAARARYKHLLEAGVRIYEYQAAMIHAKTILVDGVWGMVGTINTDNRSMAFNNEVSLVAMDATFGDALTKMFMKDIEYAKEIRLETFLRRPLWQRPLEQGAHLMSRLL